MLLSYYGLWVDQTFYSYFFFLLLLHSYCIPNSCSVLWTQGWIPLKFSCFYFWEKEDLVWPKPVCAHALWLLLPFDPCRWISSSWTQLKALTRNKEVTLSYKARSPHLNEGHLRLETSLYAHLFTPLTTHIPPERCTKSWVFVQQKTRSNTQTLDFIFWWNARTICKSNAAL